MLHAVGMLAILATWAIYAVVCVGLGGWYLLAYRRDGVRGAGGGGLKTSDVIAAFWAGLATLLGLLQAWHFFAPVGFAAHLALTSAGALAALALAKPLLGAVRQVDCKLRRRTALALLAALLFLANRATGPGAYYDAGLYHIPAVGWANAYPIVPGLANLHMRFGFSSTMTLLAAIMNAGAWAGHASHLLNGFLLTALAGMIVRAGAIVLWGRPAGAHHWLLLFSGMLVVDWAMDVQASSYSTDVGVAVLTVAAAYYFLRLFAARSSPKDARASGTLCVVLLAATVTAKASALVLAGPMTLVAWLLTAQATGGTVWAKARALLPGAAVGAALVGGWLARQVILTGYPLYPSTAFAVNVDWAVPRAKVEWLGRIILNWARWQSYDETRGRWDWIWTAPPGHVPWVRGRLLDAWALCKGVVPLVFGTIAAATAAAMWPAARRTAFARRGVLWLFGCTAAALAAWFFTAPDPRYVTQLFALWMALPLVMVVAAVQRGEPARCRRRMVALAAVLAAVPLVAGSNAADHEGARTVRGVWLLPPPNGGMFYAEPNGAWEEVTTAGGVTVNVPVGKNGAFEDRAWHAPLPNTPRSEIDPDEVAIPPLRWRTPGRAENGFKR